MSFIRWYDAHDRHKSVVREFRVAIARPRLQASGNKAGCWTSSLDITGLELRDQPQGLLHLELPAADPIAALTEAIQHARQRLLDWQAQQSNGHSIAWRTLGTPGMLDLIDSDVLGQTSDQGLGSTPIALQGSSILARDLVLTQDSGASSTIRISIDDPVPYDGAEDSPYSARFSIEGLLSRGVHVPGSGHGLDPLGAIQSALENCGLFLRSSAEGRAEQLTWEANPKDPLLGFPRLADRLDRMLQHMPLGTGASAEEVELRRSLADARASLPIDGQG